MLGCVDAGFEAIHAIALKAAINGSILAVPDACFVMTMRCLAALPLPLPWKPERGSVQSLEKVREQARVQLEGRTQGKVVFETLPVVADFGLCLLPPPSPGDIFLDFEGDPFVSGGGREFLFGYPGQHGRRLPIASSAIASRWQSPRSARQADRSPQTAQDRFQ